MKQFILLFVTIIIGCLSDTTNATFTCIEQGIFPNPDSNDCKTFVICDSNLNPKVFDCLPNTYFWPAKKGCFSLYNCASNTIRDNINPCENMDFSLLPDKTSADCTRYLQCSTYTVFLYEPRERYAMQLLETKQCPSGTAYRPDNQCTATHRCVNYKCTTEGLFKNPNDCSTFIQCWKYNTYTKTGTISSLFPDLNYCPPNTKFNPFLKKCDSFYNCNGIDPHGGIDPCLNYNKANPFVPNPYNNAATSYISCQHDFNYPFNNVPTRDVIIKKQCPANTFFSPLLGKCYDNYDPNETCSKDPCSSGPGKYVNYDSQSGYCKSFIKCRDSSTTRELYQPIYEIFYCPPGTRYSPQLSNCSRQYVCPPYPSGNYCYPQIPTTTTPEPQGGGSGGNN